MSIRKRLEKCLRIANNAVVDAELEAIGDDRMMTLAESQSILVDSLMSNGVTVRNWIPAEERQPKTDGRFMVTVKSRRGKPHVEMRNYNAGSQMWEKQCAVESVLAWQDRPEPYGWNLRGNLNGQG